MSVDVSDKFAKTLPGIIALAIGIPVRAAVPRVVTTFAFAVLKFVRSEVAPPLSSFLRVKPRNTPNLKVWLR
jgi:hypothetical protein